MMHSLEDALEVGDRERRLLQERLATQRTNLPLRYWRQQVHMTTPASDSTIARKAIEAGTATVPRALDRLDLKGEDLADCLRLPATVVAEYLASARRPPLVMLDGEDAIAPSEAASSRAVDIAVEMFSEVDWGDTLRFFRPPSLGLEGSVRDLLTLLWRVREQTPTGHRIPLDGIVFPKIEHPEEVDFVHDLLLAAERDLGLELGSIRVSYLVESGWAVAQLPEIAKRAAPRLAGLIFGIADFSADLGLPSIDNQHPLVDWARSQIVAVSGAVGVPAIDGMTLDYPVIDPTLDVHANRARWLARMRLVYDDAVRARQFGMSGKWVGHPAQLLAVMLAFEVGDGGEALEHEAAKLAAYDTAVAADQGTTLIDGVMSDRATDRHARVVLRRATALGQFDAERAAALGVISLAELEHLRVSNASQSRPRRR